MGLAWRGFSQKAVAVSDRHECEWIVKVLEAKTAIFQRFIPPVAVFRTHFPPKTAKTPVMGRIERGMSIENISPVQYERPDYTKMDMRQLGAQKAIEHPLMAQRLEIAQTVKTMTAIPDRNLVPDAQLPYSLQSIIQRPNERVWQWTPTDSDAAVPVWLARAISEALESCDLRILPNANDPLTGKLFRRAVGDRFSWDEPCSWMPISSLRIAYGGTGRDDVPGADSWMQDWLSQAGRTISPGMTFLCTDGAWRGEYCPRINQWALTEIDEDGASTVRANWDAVGQVVERADKDGNVTFRAKNLEYVKGRLVDTDKPTVYTTYTNLTRAQARQAALDAGKILSEWTDHDVKSKNILGFMLASMFMRNHPEQCYVVQGPGGTGKSSLCKDLVAHLGRQAMTFSLDLLSQPTAMSTENAMVELSSHLLALTDDYDPRSGRFAKILPPFKTLLTGLLPFSARRRGEDALVNSLPQAVHVLTTNYHLPIDDSEAEQRRFMFATLSNRGTFRDKYLPFRETYGFWPFMMFGMFTWCWRNGDHDAFRGVSFVDASSLSDREVDMVRAVMERGYVESSIETRGMRWSALGLVRSSRRENGKAHVIYRPADEDSPLYGTWCCTRDAVKGIAVTDPDMTDVDSFRPLDVDAVDWAREKRAGGETGLYVPAGGGEDGKVAYNWRNKVKDGEATELPDFTEHDAQGQVCGEDEIVVDWDACHDGSDVDHGLNRMERDMGSRIGTEAFPMPFLERSARGGLHGAYGVPAWLVPYFKKAAVGANVSGDPTLLVDLRAPLGGYVVAVGSRIKAGSYEAVARPEGGERPMLTQPMLEWFAANGFLNKPLPASYEGLDGVKHVGAAERPERPMTPAKPDASGAYGRDAFPDVRHGSDSASTGVLFDMSPIPEGQRNVTLYKQAFGLMVNHRARWEDVCDKVMERGHISHMGDRELHTILNSVADSLGLKRV
jgi:YD repeat-containing protein